MTSMEQLVRKVIETDGYLYCSFVENGAKRTIRVGEKYE